MAFVRYRDDGLIAFEHGGADQSMTPNGVELPMVVHIAP